MFKNVPHVKTKCGNKNASERFAERKLFLTGGNFM